MSALLNWKVLLLGIVSWVVPFVASFLFFGPGGELAVPLPLFKSLMIVIFGGLGALLLVFAFRHVSPTLANGAALGGLWLLMNLALDLAILVPMVRMELGSYVQDIGLRYLLMPIMGAAIGTVAQRVRA